MSRPPSHLLHTLDVTLVLTGIAVDVTRDEPDATHLELSVFAGHEVCVIRT